MTRRAGRWDDPGRQRGLTPPCTDTRRRAHRTAHRRTVRWCVRAGGLVGTRCTRRVDRDPPADGISSGLTRRRGIDLSAEIDISRLIVAGVVRMRDLPTDTVLDLRPELPPTRQQLHPTRVLTDGVDGPVGDLSWRSRLTSKNWQRARRRSDLGSIINRLLLEFATSPLEAGRYTLN